jgi:hypothetical protein
VGGKKTMTEQEWLASTKPWKLFQILRGEGKLKHPTPIRVGRYRYTISSARFYEFGKPIASERKFRLFSCACCRSYWPEMSEQTRAAFERLEELSDATTAIARADIVRIIGIQAAQAIHNSPKDDDACTPAYLYYLAAKDGISAAGHSLQTGTDSGLDEAILSFMRDIFGNPFRPTTISPAILAWHDRIIPRLAQAIYEERQMPSGTFDPARMNILADALLDAGCDNEDIIQHCRSDKPHVRGCYVGSWICFSASHE